MSLYTDYHSHLRVRLPRVFAADKPQEVMGFAVSVGRGRGKLDRPICTHYHKVGHDVAKCWSLVACSHYKKHIHAVENCSEIVGYPN